MTPFAIPERSTSRYAGHYSYIVDAPRLLEILADSVRLALGSKNPVTALDRFQLAVELYHQLMTLRLPQELRSSVEQTVSDMVEQFPLQVRVNEALGLCEKARKLKTPRRRLELFYRSRDILRDALAANPSGSDALRSVQAQVVAGIAEAAYFGRSRTPVSADVGQLFRRKSDTRFTRCRTPERRRGAG